jgi:upstream activation factor subunit UAF30
MATTKKGGTKRGTAKKAPARGAAKKASARGGTKTTGARRTAKRASAGKTRTKRAPNPSFMKPMQPDEALGAVVGSKAMPRTEVTKKLWAYIKKNNLQDARERRMINADDKLRPLFGGKRQVSMFEMTKLVNAHLREA